MSRTKQTAQRNRQVNHPQQKHEPTSTTLHHGKPENPPIKGRKRKKSQLHESKLPFAICTEPAIATWTNNMLAMSCLRVRRKACMEYMDSLEHEVTILQDNITILDRAAKRWVQVRLTELDSLKETLLRFLETRVVARQERQASRRMRVLETKVTAGENERMAQLPRRRMRGLDAEQQKVARAERREKRERLQSE
ncbi:hypothetical protein EKO04_001773 [Ascochyta lentis]|uniref:Uncharacterized protein n=1 Tax=Ascochyta lentis TaxID=205686 RepID=A0A8H7JBW6_9PLEO|nr:hypothetical protein EKO04_001773 [Ascochyta lentis]